MIRITRPQTPPEILKTKGKNKRRALSAAYNRGPQDYLDGNRKFAFDKKVYGHKSVKAALISAQHEKCAFCESKVTHIASGDVEHFRPKAGYRQTSDDPLGRPGYYWLAYEWENLLFCCELCNRRFKANLFPLVDPANRPKSHRDSVAREAPLFINPTTEDPERYVSFRKEIPYAINDNERGKATIASLGLDRAALNERRFDRYEMIFRIHTLANATPPLPESAEAQALLQRAVQDSAEYAAMVRAAIDSAFELEN